MDPPRGAAKPSCPARSCQSQEVVRPPHSRLSLDATCRLYTAWILLSTARRRFEQGREADPTSVKTRTWPAAQVSQKA
jgi:hypothetical protein